MSDIIITPNKGSANAPTIQFSGSANASASIRLEVLPEGQVAFLGKSGSLFSISDNMVGSLMAVSDISGLPILEVFSDDRIIMGKYNKNTLYVSGTNVGVRKVPLNAVLDVSGSVAVTGSLGVAGSILADGGVTASLLGTASYALNALTASYSYSGTSGTSGAGTISGGTASYVARFTGATTLSTGVIYDNATNVGIGTAEPAAKLHAVGTGGAIRMQDTTATAKYIQMRSDSANSHLEHVGGPGDELRINNQAAGTIEFFTSNTERMRIASTGNVGIGTTTPGLYDGESSDLVVFRAATAGITIAVSDTSSRAAIRFADGTTGNEAYRGGIEYDHGTGSGGTADSLHFRTAAALRMSIDGSGNVGIGTTSPSAKLQTQINYATSANDSDDADATILIENIHASGDAVLRMRGATGVSSVVYGKNGGTDRLNFIPRNDNGQRIAFNQNGVVSISNTTAGSANAGALIVQGGISAGNTGSAASWFGGAVTVTGTLRATNGNLYTYGESGNATDGILFFNSAANNYIWGSGSQLAIYTAGVQRATISSTAATFAGAVGAPSLTSPASTNLTLGTTSFGTALTVVSSNGQVGIGTATPGDRLVVSNAGAAGLEFGVTTSVINQAYNRSTSNYVDYQDNCLNRIFATNGTTEAMRIASTGNVSIASTTAGSSGVGALVVAGGLATGAASYLGGNTTVNGEFRASNIRLENGTFIAFGSADGEGMTGSQSANSLTLRTNSTTALTINSAQAATFAGAVTVSGTGTFSGIGGIVLNGATKVIYFGNPSADYLFFNGSDLITRINSVDRLTIASTGTVSISSTTAASSSTAGAFLVGNGTAATNVAIGGGKVNIGDTTAGSSGAGALVVTGGGSFGNNGSASYFGGAVTVGGALSAATFSLASSTGQIATINSTAANGPYVTFLASSVAAGDIGSAANVFGAGTSTDFGVNSRGTTLYLGQGNSVRATISSTAATFAGDVSAQRLEAVDAAANNRAAAFIRTQNNTTYNSSVLSIQGDRTTTNASYNLIYATNGDTTGVFAVRDSGNAVNTNNSYGSISDQKLKENIVDATSKLEKLNQVRIVNFNRIGNEQKQLGVIAQELEQIFPSMVEEAIDRDAEGNDLGTTTKSVKYSVFVPMLIKAIQELTTRLAAVEAK